MKHETKTSRMYYKISTEQQIPKYDNILENENEAVEKQWQWHWQ